MWAEETPVYTFSTAKSTANTAYATNYDVTINGVSWSVPGNQNFSGYVRIGGKSITTNVDREIYSKGTLSNNISKITFNHNGRSNSKLVVNSVTLVVASNSTFNSEVDRIVLNPTIEVSTAGSFDFTPSSVSVWPSGSYYKFIINVTNEAGSNYGLDVTSIAFYGASTQAYTVTLGDNNETLTETSGGAGVTLPSRSDVGSYTFAGWSTTNVTTETTTAPTIIPAGAYQPTGNITLYPVYTRTEGGGTVNKSASVSISDYATANSWVSGSNSGPQYTEVVLNSDITATTTGTTNNGKYYSSDDTWRFYTTGDGNVIISTTAGTLSSVTLTFSSGGFTYDGDAITSGNAVSVSGTSAEFTCTSNAKITAISVNYSASGSTTYYISTPSGQEKVATPTITIPAGAFVSTKNVTIECATAGAAIQYSTDGGTNWAAYSDPFTISATTTVQAKATKSGMDDSSVAEETFTKETVLNGLSALVANTNTSDATYYVSLTDAQVTWANGTIGYMEDSNAGVYLYNVSPTQNTVYNGIFSVKYQVYNSMPEIKSITAVEGSTASGSAKAATVMTTSALDAAFDANLGRQIQINGFTVPSSKELTSNIFLYETSPYTSVTAGTTYNLVGYPFYAKVNGTVTKQFRITIAVEKVLLENAITGINETYTVDLANSEDEVDLSGATATSSATVQYTVTNSTIDAKDYDLTAGGVLTVSGNGVITVRAYVDADEDYNGAEKLVTVTVVDDPVIGYAGESETTVYGTPYTVDTDLIEGGAVSLSSGNTAIATVDNLVITPVAVGEVTITVNTAATNIWHAGTATFTLNVTAPEGKTTAYNPVATIFEETFAGCESTGGNDGSWSGSIATGTLNDDGTDNDGWTFEHANAASGCAKFGSGKAGGSATTPAIGRAGTFTLTFKAAAWDATSEGTTLDVSAENATLRDVDDTEDVSSVTMTKGAWTTYTLIVKDATADATITFSTSAGNKRFFLDEVKVTGAGDPFTATLNSAGYGTYCSEYPLDFSEATDYSAWYITGTSGETITFEKVTGSVKGGTGLFLKGENGTTGDIELTSVNSSNTLSGNMLVGTLAPTYFAQDAIYGLAGSTFKHNNAGTFKANKAYIPASEIDNNGSGVRAFTFVFVDPTTGITETRNVSAEEFGEIVNLAGQRMSKPQKGVNIINGKKVLVK